jgi:transglutaminase-like putative cysteine protease
LLVAIAAAVWLQHGTLLGREAGVTFLLLLMGLKLLEMRARRDVFVVVFLAFFILLTQFLFGQGLLLAVVAVAAVAALFFVLISVHLGDGDLTAGHKLRLVGLLMLKAVPLTIVLFLLFPRLSGPLWGLPGEGSTSTSGLSNSMSPGTISQLLESDEIAMRVRFDKEPPAREYLYWRGPVFGAFDGKTWSPLQGYLEGTIPAATVKMDTTSAVSYTVTLEPHRKNWLFALEMATLPEATGSNPLDARYTPDFLIVSAGNINERVRYQATSFTRYAMSIDASEITLANWLQLPPGYNPRTLQFATELKNRVVASDASRHESDVALVNAVLDTFRREGFGYTLTPPLLGRNGVDDFLFKTRQGYCEHYASAFVVLMRALDVPARVVTGYQGGEIHPVDAYLTIRQSDAHAWAEVGSVSTRRQWLRRCASIVALRPLHGSRAWCHCLTVLRLWHGCGPCASIGKRWTMPGISGSCLIRCSGNATCFPVLD